MKINLKKIHQLLESDLTSYKIMKETGIKTQIIDRYRTKQTKLENMTLKIATNLQLLIDRLEGKFSLFSYYKEKPSYRYLMNDKGEKIYELKQVKNGLFNELYELYTDNKIIGEIKVHTEAFSMVKLPKLTIKIKEKTPIHLCLVMEELTKKIEFDTTQLSILGDFNDIFTLFMDGEVLGSCRIHSNNKVVYITPEQEKLAVGIIMGILFLL